MRAAISSSPSSTPIAMMPRDSGLSNSVSSHFLITPNFVTITMYLIGHEFLHRQEGLHGLVRLEVDQVGDVLAFADGGGVGNLVNLEPVDPALVGEDQQVGVGGGDEEVFDEILGARAHADAAFAAARLAAIGIDGGALQVAAVRDGDGDVFHCDQVFETDLAGVFDDLGAALVAEILLDFLELLDDEVAEDFFGAEDFEVFGDAALDIGQLVGDLLLLHAGEALQLELDDGLRLPFGELASAARWRRRP